MGRHPTLLLLLLGAAGAWHDRYCPLAVEYSCQDGQPAYQVCRHHACDGIHTEAENVEYGCATGEYGCPLQARSWEDDLQSCDNVCERAGGASCVRASYMNDDPCASEVHEEDELSCGDVHRDLDPLRVLCWCAL